MDNVWWADGLVGGKFGGLRVWLEKAWWVKVLVGDDLGGRSGSGG